MTKSRRLPCSLALIFLFSPLFAPLFAQSQPASGLPTQQEIDTAMRRTLGYDASVKWEIYDIRPAAVPGLADVLLSINGNAPQHIYVSADRQNAIIGDAIPFGPNPFAPARQKLAAADGPTKGAAKPAIDIVVFSDLQCPHCKVAEPILNKLVSDFPQLRLIFQNFPLASIHPWAMKAAQYADCAGRQNQTAFWKFVDSIYDNQAAIAPENADTKLKELATAAGLDAQKLGACVADPQTAARVNKSIELGKSLDVGQTPTVFINGRRVLAIANLTPENLSALVNFEIANAGK
jgi:protein-disulfide isomerase